MNDPNNETTSPATDPFVEALLDAVAGHRTSANLTDDEGDLIAAIAEWAPGLPEALAELDAERDQSGPAPVRVDDPIAQMLGLVEDPAIQDVPDDSDLPIPPHPRTAISRSHRRRRQRASIICG